MCVEYCFAFFFFLKISSVWQIVNQYSLYNGFHRVKETLHNWETNEIGLCHHYYIISEIELSNLILINLLCFVVVIVVVFFVSLLLSNILICNIDFFSFCSILHQHYSTLYISLFPQ